MNIIIIQTDYPHWGNHTGINQLVKYLDRTKFNIEVYKVPDSDQDFPIQNRYIRYILRTYVQKNTVQWNGIQWYKLSDLATEIKVLANCIFKKIDIIHFLDAEHTAQFLPKILKILHKTTPKIIGTYHHHPDILNINVFRDLIPRFDLITVVSEEQTPFFEQFTERNKIHFIPHGVDTDFFRPGNIPREKDKLRCLTVGHWHRDFKAIKNVAQCLVENKNIEFHIVASSQIGPKEIGLESLPNVTIYGTIIDDTGLLHLFQQADILFLPLYRATANNTILEAIACGIPVLSTLLPSVRAYLPGKEAILIKDNEPKLFVDAILNLLHNKENLRIMSNEARRRAEELDWLKVKAKYEEIYKRSLN